MKPEYAKEWPDQGTLTLAQKKVLLDVWDIALYWGGCTGGYFSIKDIAYDLGLTTATVYNKLKIFKEAFPEAYKRLKADRARVKRVVNRQSVSFKRPKSWEDLQERYGDEADSWIVEKF
jgi:hypothetical protein